MKSSGPEDTKTQIAGIVQSTEPRRKRSRRRVFQPAEETPESGAAAMIADGTAESQDMAITLHNHLELPAGNILLTRGASTASCDKFDVVVAGVSGNTACPHATVDPIVATTTSITQITSRTQAASVLEPLLLPA